jgi:hypothetical protein
VNRECLAPWIGIKAKPKLLDATQALKLGRIDQAHHQLSFVGIGAEADNVVDRIPIDALSQFWPTFLGIVPRSRQSVMAQLNWSWKAPNDLPNNRRRSIFSKVL